MGYEGRDYDRQVLIDMYSDVSTCPASNCIGNADATSIPSEVIDGSILLNDIGAPYFDPITTKYYTKRSYSYDKDWTVFINNEFDNSLDNSNLILLEVNDPVDFTTSGTYYVTVAVKDPEGNQYNRTFKVVISGC